MAKPGPAPSVTPEGMFDVFAAREDSSEPLTAPEIADALSVSRRTIYDRLEALHERHEVTSKKVGGRSRVWWVSTDDAEESDQHDGFGAFGKSDPQFGEYALAEREQLTGRRLRARFGLSVQTRYRPSGVGSGYGFTTR